MKMIKELTLISESEGGLLSIGYTVELQGTYLDEDNGFFQTRDKMDI